MLVLFDCTQDVNDLLDTKTRSTTLGEGDEVLLEIFSAGFGFDPSLGSEDVRIREYFGVAVQ
jgi:hypothetical protein